MEDQATTPYQIHISEERLATINNKISAYDWSLLPDAGGWEAGVGIDDLKRRGHFAAMEEPELFLVDLRKFIAAVPGDKK